MGFVIFLQLPQDGVFPGLHAYDFCFHENRHPARGTVKNNVLHTTAANAVMAPIHDRMPVILSPDGFPLTRLQG